MKCVVHNIEGETTFYHLGIRVPTCHRCHVVLFPTRYPIQDVTQVRQQLKDFAVDVIKGLVSLEDTK
jgi:hypothetical protein